MVAFELACGPVAVNLVASAGERGILEERDVGCGWRVV